MPPPEPGPPPPPAPPGEVEVALLEAQKALESSKGSTGGIVFGGLVIGLVIAGGGALCWKYVNKAGPSPSTSSTTGSESLSHLDDPSDAGRRNPADNL